MTCFTHDPNLHTNPMNNCKKKAFHASWQSIIHWLGVKLTVSGIIILKKSISIQVCVNLYLSALTANVDKSSYALISIWMMITKGIMLQMTMKTINETNVKSKLEAFNSNPILRCQSPMLHHFTLKQGLFFVFLSFVHLYISFPPEDKRTGGQGINSWGIFLFKHFFYNICITLAFITKGVTDLQL